MGMQVKDGDVSCLVGEEEELVLRREAIRPREKRKTTCAKRCGQSLHLSDAPPNSEPYNR